MAETNNNTPPRNSIPGVQGFVTLDPVSRFWANVDRKSDEECWTWTGSNNGRYGRIYVNGKRRIAHQFSWELHHGKTFPVGLDGCHTCDNPPCVNPHHIFPGTRSENGLDASRKGRLHNVRKTHCKRGHPLSGANLYIKPDGWRTCNACKRLRRAKGEI